MRIADRTIRTVALAVALALAAACGDSPPPPPPIAPLATVAHVAGDVRVRRGGIGEWISLADGAELGPGDQVQALDHSTATLELAATHAELVVAANTTMRLDADHRPRAVSGQLVARLPETAEGGVLEVSIPSAILVIATSPATSAEAAVEVSDAETTIAMRDGSGTLVPDHGETVAIPAHHQVRFDRNGQQLPPPSQSPSASPPSPAVALPQVELDEPADGARVRVRQAVTVRWHAVAGADGYRLSIVTGTMSRQLGVTATASAVSIASGHYTWSVQAVHGDEVGPASASRSFDADVRNTPPPISIIEPRLGATVQGPQLAIEGTTSPGVTIEVNGTSTVADSRGRFSIPIAISRGLSNLVISAHDDVGNTRRVSRSVLWE